MSNARRTSLPAVAVFLVALLVVTILLSLASGAFQISLSDLLRIIGDGPQRNLTDEVAHNVFWQVRLPRVVLAVVGQRLLNVERQLIEDVL